MCTNHYTDLSQHSILGFLQEVIDRYMLVNKMAEVIKKREKKTECVKTESNSGSSPVLS